jgi:hypothetical protein
MVSALFEGEPAGARTSDLSTDLSAEARRAKAEARQRGSDVGRGSDLLMISSRAKRRLWMSE